MKCEKCFFSCSQCSDTRYDDCLVCRAHRGLDDEQPVAGTCECQQKREHSDGSCDRSRSSVLAYQIVMVSFIVVCSAISCVVGLINQKFILFFSFVDQMQLMSTIFYVDIYYPNNLGFLLQILDRLNINRLFLPSKSPGGLDSIKYRSDFTKFTLNGIGYNFIDNSLLILGLLCGFCIFTLAIRKLTFLKKLSHLDLSMLIVLLYFLSGEICLYAVLQLHHPKFDAEVIIVSLFLSLMSLAALIVIIWLLLRIQRTLMKGQTMAEKKTQVPF